jgi:hypothetical protein
MADAQPPTDAYERGMAHLDKGEYEQALTDFNEAIRQDPQLPSGYAGRANALRNLGDEAGALRDEQTVERMGGMKSANEQQRALIDALLLAAGATQAPARPEDDPKAKLTTTGCILTTLTLAIILGVALPIVRWRDPVTREPLPRLVAIATPFLIGAVFHGIATVLLRLVGLPVWAKGSDESPGDPAGAGPPE